MIIGSVVMILLKAATAAALCALLSIECNREGFELPKPVENMLLAIVGAAIFVPVPMIVKALYD